MLKTAILNIDDAASVAASHQFIASKLVDLSLPVDASSPSSSSVGVFLAEKWAESSKIVSLTDDQVI